LKVSILEKQTEINEKIKQRQKENTKLKPQMKKLGKMFQMGNRRESKKKQDMGCGGTDPIDDIPSSSSARV
jgi:hypothetical protein